jgi:hypothetical protein
MHGELLWFNETRQDGLITTSDGEKIRVQGSGFLDGQVPVGRCAGTAVTFEIEGTGEDARAVSVAVLDIPASRRARMRSQRR